MGRHGRDGFKRISAGEYQNLVNGAVSVAFQTEAPPYPEDEKCIRTVKTKVEVPVEKTVQVPVEKKVPQRNSTKKIVRGTELVPVKKVKEVEETTVEVQEEVVHGYRWVWKRVKEPTTQVVKKPVTVTKTRKVPYTDYEERPVELVVDVPCDKVEVQQGFREDKQITSKIVEVEQDEIYAVRPLYLGKGEMRMKEVDGKRDLGYSSGREFYNGRAAISESPRPRSGGMRNGEAHSAARPKSRSHHIENYTPRTASSKQRPASAGAARTKHHHRGHAVPPSGPRPERGRPHPHGITASNLALHSAARRSS